MNRLRDHFYQCAIGDWVDASRLPEGQYWPSVVEIVDKDSVREEGGTGISSIEEIGDLVHFTGHLMKFIRIVTHTENGLLIIWKRIR